MPHENLEIARKAMALNSSGDREKTIEATVGLADPDFEFQSRVAAVEGRIYKGHEGARVYYQDMSDAFREWHNEVVDIAEIGPDAVLVDALFRGTGKTSGMETELASAIVFVFSEGKIARILAGRTRDEALAAAGLAE